MVKIIFLINISLFAHESLESTICKNTAGRIQIKKLQGQQYKISMPGKHKTWFSASPTVKDEFDPNIKQLFDTYRFKIEKHELVIKRPETKGPIKKLRAFLDGKPYDCQ